MRVLQGYHTAFSDPTLNSRGSRFMDLGRGADRWLDALKIMQCPRARLPLAKKEINTYIHTYIRKILHGSQSINSKSLATLFVSQLTQKVVMIIIKLKGKSYMPVESTRSCKSRVKNIR